MLLVHRVLAICAAQIREVDGEETVAGIHPCPLPGHTPGHTGYRLEAGDTSLLIWGILSISDIQTTRPSVSVAFDVDPEQARQTRNFCCARPPANNG
ncbi:metallo-beta-lactamase [Klebsiella aerogenes]|nr:metallo-beta-lactamase [Klebsiella aerogenes]